MSKSKTMKTMKTMKTIISDMDTIILIIKDSNYFKYEMKLTIEEAFKLAESDLIHNVKVKITGTRNAGYHENMTITVN